MVGPERFLLPIILLLTPTIVFELPVMEELLTYNVL